MTARRPGRPRSEQAWSAVLQATREELSTRGYDGFSIDRVAAAAGVGKQTVYRWYPSKSALVAECILRGLVMTPALPVDDSGDLGRDIAAWLAAFAANTDNPDAVALILAGTAAAAEDAGIAARYRDMTAATEEALVDRLRRGVEAGQLAADVPVAGLAGTIVGAVLYRVLTRQRITPAFRADLVRLLFGDSSGATG